MTRTLWLLALAGASLGSAGVARAQALSCALPKVIARPTLVLPSEADPVRRTAVGGYALALSWSPQFCRTAAAKGTDLDFQCRSGARFGFVLHGLWPDGGAGAPPQFCRPAKLLPAKVVRANLCMSPSVNLLQHEWAKHGTCMSKRPQAYFAEGRKLYGALRFPDMGTLAGRDGLTLGAFQDAFLAANRHVPGLTAASLRLRTDREGWVEEVYLCLDQRLRYAACRRAAPNAAALARTLRVW